MTLTYGSLFSGVGGFDIGFDRAGFQCAWQVEIDEHCQSVLRRHWPDVPKFRDVRDVGAHNLAPVDVIIGGWPCQDHSVAGQRKGFDGARSSLFWEFARIVAELRPRWLCAENVPGLLSQADEFRSVIRAFDERGYLGAWRILDAQFFGVPQRRRRVYLVAGLGAAGERAAEVLFESARLPGDPAPRRGSREDVAKAVRASTGSRHADDADRLTFVPVDTFNASLGAAVSSTLQGSPGRGRNLSLPAVLEQTVPSITAHYGKGTDSDFTAPHVLTPIGTRGDPDGPANAVNTHSNRYDAESQAFVVAQCHGTNVGPMGTLRRGNGNTAGGVPFVATAFHPTQDPINSVELSHALGVEETGSVAVFVSENQRAELRETPLSRQLTAGGGKPGQGYGAVREGAAVRRLTPRETERLQGWPDDHTRWDDQGREISDSTRYRCVGNGVASPVAEWIATRLRAVLERAA